MIVPVPRNRLHKSTSLDIHGGAMKPHVGCYQYFELLAQFQEMVWPEHCPAWDLFWMYSF